MKEDITTLFLGRARDILSFLGIWHSAKNGWIRQIFMIIILTMEYSFMIFHIIKFIQRWNDVQAAEISVAMNLLTTCCKAIAFIGNESNLKTLLDSMKSEVFQPQNKEHERILIDSAKKIKMRCVLYFVFFMMTGTLWAMIQVIDTNGGPTGFPFDIWMPVGPEHSPGREIGWIYQVSAVYFSVVIYVTVDYVILSIMMLGCAQLQIIREKLKKIRFVPITLMRNKTMRDKLLEDNNTILIECIRQHQAVIRFLKTFENACNLLFLFQIMVIVGIICNLCLQIVVTDVFIDRAQFVSLSGFMAITLYQLLLICWTGHDLIISSDELRGSLYECPWYEQDPRFRRAMLTAMQRMNYPLRIRAGRYIPLDRPLFISIVRSSYSYFTVLRKVSYENIE